MINHRPILEIKLNRNKLSLSGEICGRNGETALLINNEFWLNQNLTFHSEHPDRSTLIVRDNTGVETLKLRYLNREAIVFSGDFFSEEVGDLIIDNESVRLIRTGSSASKNCLATVPVMIAAEPGALILGDSRR
jgi:hypothetical protein